MTARRALLAATLTLVALPAAAEPVTVEATPIERFDGAGIGERADGLIFRGGVDLNATADNFGGISDITIFEGARFVAAIDSGWLLSGALTHDAQGTISGMDDVEVTTLTNTAGERPRHWHDTDAEAIDLIERDGAPAAVRVGFERNTFVLDYALRDGRPGPPGLPVSIPPWLDAVRGNASIEALCVAPERSPVAGSTLIVTEGETDAVGNWRATLLGEADRGDLALAPASGLNPTSCAFLPDGDLLVLERGLFMLSFSVQIRRIDAADVVRGNVMDGAVLLSASGRDVDNFEGLDVYTDAAGETRIAIISDDNFNGFQRTLIYEFALPRP